MSSLNDSQIDFNEEMELIRRRNPNIFLTHHRGENEKAQKDQGTTEGQKEAILLGLRQVNKHRNL
jgi:hypothetical protein